MYDQVIKDNESNLKQSYHNLKKEFPALRELLLKNISLSSDEGQIRSLEDAQLVLDTISTIQLELSSCFFRVPSLWKIFDQEFTPFKEFLDRENIIETCFLDDFIFPEEEKLPMVIEGTLNRELLASYITTFRDWIKEHEKGHLECQQFIREKNDSSFYLNQLQCQCIQCIADYRTKLREILFSDCAQMVDQAVENIKQKLAASNINISENVPPENSPDNTFLISGNENYEVLINTINTIVYELQKELDKRIYSIRNRLKRASISKLENQIKGITKNKLGPSSLVGKKYLIILKPIFENYLKERNLSPTLVENSEYERFYRQQGINIWKDRKFLLREFSKLVNSVLILKRKDISSTILQEYLGQFWLHSEARKINRKVIYHLGPTNSGKTFHAIYSLCKAKKGCYLAPLRLLAAELFDTMQERGVKTTLLTGEEVIEVEDSTHYSSTIEMAKLHEQFDCVVIDEIQMISDPQRGWAWTRALIGISAEEVHICGDDSVVDLVKKIVEMTGDTLEFRTYERMTKLEVMDHTISLGGLTKGDALIVFSRKNALKYKSELERLGFKVSIIYGMLGPEVRREQARKFDQGETDIMVSTDAIAMGMNLPIKRIVFSTLSKFIDDKEYRLSASEIKQIAGRSGRYKRFPIGYVTCLGRVDGGIEEIKAAMLCELEQKTCAMVGPDLDIYNQVNRALTENSLPHLELSEFLHLFNTMSFEYPYYCVDLKEMIEVTEMVETANEKYKTLTSAEIFGFACAPINLGLVEHIQYFIFILNNFIRNSGIKFEEINYQSDNIDYLETSIKCLELYQWLARHFNKKNFIFEERDLLYNKSLAIEKLNRLLSEHLTQSCYSCGQTLPPESAFSICEKCFKERRFRSAQGGRRVEYGGLHGRMSAKNSHRRQRGGAREQRRARRDPQDRDRQRRGGEQRNQTVGQMRPRRVSGRRNGWSK